MQRLITIGILLVLAFVIIYSLISFIGSPTAYTPTPVATSSIDSVRDEAVPGQATDAFISSPRAQQEIVPGFIARGRANGTWLFEASTGVELRDRSGRLLWEGVATVDDGYDWMTTSTVPWSAELSFTRNSVIAAFGTSTVVSTTTLEAGIPGLFIFRKSNPSGDPIRDAALEIPVRIQLDSRTPEPL